MHALQTLSGAREELFNASVSEKGTCPVHCNILGGAWDTTGGQPLYYVDTKGPPSWACYRHPVLLSSGYVFVLQSRQSLTICDHCCCSYSGVRSIYSTCIMCSRAVTLLLLSG
jgi:hypothetical protein